MGRGDTDPAGRTSALHTAFTVYIDLIGQGCPDAARANTVDMALGSYRI